MSFAVTAVAVSAVGIGLGYKASRDSAKATEKSGKNIQAALDFDAEQLDVAAGQTQAAGQYGAAEIRRQGKIVESDLVAKVAASGGDVSDPSIMNIIGRNAGEVQHRAMIEMYAAEDEARTLRARATTSRMGAQSALGDSKAAASAIRSGGVASAVLGFGGMMAQYWKPPAKTEPVTG